NAHLLAVGVMFGHAAFRAGGHQVLDAHVGERAARHNAVVAAARTVAVEVAHFDTPLDQVLPRRRSRFGRTGRADVIGRHRIADDAQRPSAGNVLDYARLHAEAFV